MYGIPQSVLLAHDQLSRHLSKYGYKAFQNKPILWPHKTQPISFCVIFDNFSIKYVGGEKPTMSSTPSKTFTPSQFTGKALSSVVSH